MAGVAVNLLTGFLGSGKTTLLKHVLEHGLDGRRVAIVMNEIGEVGIDGKVITGMKAVEKMVEVSNGCICCSISGQFQVAVREILANARPHLIVIESTGVADPAALAGQVREAGLHLDAVITVVDAAHIGRQLKEAEVASRQIEAADFLVLNKTDLVGERELARVEARLRRLNPRAVLRRSAHGRVDTDLLFGTSVGRIRQEIRDHGHDHLRDDRIEAFVFQDEPGRLFDRRRFEGFLRRLPAACWRAKGIVLFEGETTPTLFHFTCGRVELEWFPLPKGTEHRNQGVFIGQDLLKHEARLRRRLEACRPEARRGFLGRFRGGA